MTEDFRADINKEVYYVFEWLMFYCCYVMFCEWLMFYGYIMFCEWLMFYGYIMFCEWLMFYGYIMFCEWLMFYGYIMFCEWLMFYGCYLMFFDDSFTSLLTQHGVIISFLVLRIRVSVSMEVKIVLLCYT